LESRRGRPTYAKQDRDKSKGNTAYHGGKSLERREIKEDAKGVSKAGKKKRGWSKQLTTAEKLLLKTRPWRASVLRHMYDLDEGGSLEVPCALLPATREVEEPRRRKKAGEGG